MLELLWTDIEFAEMDVINLLSFLPSAYCYGKKKESSDSPENETQSGRRKSPDYRYGDDLVSYA